jgi:hypothetical protein
MNLHIAISSLKVLYEINDDNQNIKNQSLTLAFTYRPNIAHRNTIFSLSLSLKKKKKNHNFCLPVYVCQVLSQRICKCRENLVIWHIHVRSPHDAVLDATHDPEMQIEIITVCVHFIYKSLCDWSKG